MKLIVFKETGEVRRVQRDEWYGVDGGPIYQWLDINSSWSDEHPIYERIEIEVPKGMSIFTYCFRNDLGFATDNKIILSRPKVKKWVWERDYDNSHTSNMKVVTKIPFSEKEIWGDGNRWRRVPGTEIEVEED